MNLTAVGDARHLPFADGVAQTCVTSPPYFGLRDYGQAGQIGMERTVNEYVQNMVIVMREVRRVLRDDGTLWLNLGDSYAGSGRGAWDAPPERKARIRETYTPSRAELPTAGMTFGLKHKDMIGIPWRVAFALQDDGWYLRRDIIWHKPNPMPSSVTDRPTTSHEYVFLLAKQERYFYDADAIAEPVSESTNARLSQPNLMNQAGSARAHAGEKSNGRLRAQGQINGTRNARSVWTITTGQYSGAHYAIMPDELARRCILAGTSQYGSCAKCGAPYVRNGDGFRPSCVCDLHGLKPNDLEIIQSRTGDGGSIDETLTEGRQGLGRQRMPDEGRRPMTRFEQREYASQLRALHPSIAAVLMLEVGDTAYAHYIRTDLTGARPIPLDTLESWIGRQILSRVEPPSLDFSGLSRQPCIVLDPFMGSGTTAKVSISLGRQAIGTDLSPEYVSEHVGKRTTTTIGMGI